MSLPWIEVPAIEPVKFARIRRRTVFDCCKWDPQFQDHGVLFSTPFVLRRDAWRELTDAAEALFAETMAAEAELCDRPDLHRELGIPRGIRRALARGRRDGLPVPGGPRVLRFDFHPTSEGWALSEVNADVPGGYIEASGFSALVSDACPGAAPAGDPAGDLARAVAARVPSGATVALVYATSYVDDAQVARYLGARLRAIGIRPIDASAAHVFAEGDRAVIRTLWHDGRVDALFRFFPAEWLGSSGPPLLPFLRAHGTPQTNPVRAILTQSKRFPLVWPFLHAPLSAWPRFLPATVDPRDARRDPEGWILKPAFGRVGERIGMPGVTPARKHRAIRRAAALAPRSWIAQRRFEAIPWTTDAGAFFPCVGVFVVDGRVAGAYGRIARRPLVDQDAFDVAVLVESATTVRAGVA